MFKRPNEKTFVFRKRNIEQKYPALKTYVDVSALAAERYAARKHFNYMYVDFGDLFAPLIDSKIPISNRIQKHKNLLLHENNKLLEQDYREVRDIARIDQLYLRLEDISRYKRALQSIFSQLKKISDWDLAEQIIVPLRGGGVVANLFPDLKEKLIPFDCKRIPLARSFGHFGFGMHIKEEFGDVRKADKVIIENKAGHITFLEICVASGLTTLGFLLDLAAKKVEIKRLDIVCAAVSQQALLIVSEFAKEQKIHVRFITGRIIYSLSDFFTDPVDALLEDDNQWTIGDAVGIMSNYTE